MLEVIRDLPEPTFTLFIPFTRQWILEDFFTNLDRLLMPLAETEAVFYNDTDDKDLQAELWTYLKRSKFGGARVYMSGNRAPTETSAYVRRQRIVEMKNKSKELIKDGCYVIGIEDDTFPQDPDTIKKLINHIENQENIGFVSGVERGRWGFAMIGAWEMDDINDPRKVSTLPYKKAGMQLVDGAGWYCYITTSQLYKSVEYRFEADCLGPDVCYVMDLRRRGYECYVDWSLVCGHRTRTRNLIPSEECDTFTWVKADDDTWRIIAKE